MNINLLKLFFLIFALFAFCENIYSQKEIQKGDEYFEKRMFKEAIPFYTEVIKNGNSASKVIAMSKIGSCYSMLGEYTEAENWFMRALLSDKRNPIHHKNYAIALKNSFKFKEAIEELNKYADKNPKDTSVNNLIEGCKLMEKWFDEVPQYSFPHLMNFNSSVADYAPTYYNHGIVFCSERNGEKPKDNKMINSNLYYVNLNIPENKIPEAKELKIFNTSGFEGPATFNTEGNKMFYTTSISNKENPNKNVLQIWYREKDAKGNWSKPQNILPFNSNNYNVAYPSLSYDGKKLYFMSDMQGGLGGSDIYVSEFINGKWSEPKNLGAPINTPGNETYPYIYIDGTLYFSSDYLPGMGRLDIFSSKYIYDKWTTPVNLKPPINTTGDDFGLVLDKRFKNGFYTSDGFFNNKIGNYDIYSFAENEPLKILFKGDKLLMLDNSLFNEKIFYIKNDNLANENILHPEYGFYSYEMQSNNKNELLIKDHQNKIKNTISITLENDTSFYSKHINILSQKEPITIEGWLLKKTIDDTTGIPIVGATVSLSNNNNIIEQNLSDIEGHYKFNTLLEKEQQYKISSNGGKFAKNITIITCKGVVSSQGKRLGSVNINIKRNGITLTNIFTNENGEYSYPLENKYSYSFSIKGGDNFNDTIINVNINSNALQTSYILDIELSKRSKRTIIAKTDSLSSLTKDSIIANKTDSLNQISKISHSDSLVKINPVLPSTATLDYIILQGSTRLKSKIFPNVIVKLMSDGNILQQIKTDTSGKFIFKLSENQKYSITGSKDGSPDRIISLSTAGKKNNDTININLDMDAEQNIDNTLALKKDTTHNFLKNTTKEIAKTNTTIKTITDTTSSKQTTKITSQNDKIQIANNNTPKQNAKVDTEKITDIDNSVIFKVQIGASKNSLPEHYFQNIENNFHNIKITETKTPENIFKYTVGDSPDLNKILQLHNEIIKKGQDAYIVAFKNNKQITIKEALEYYRKQNNNISITTKEDIKNNLIPISSNKVEDRSIPFEVTPYEEGLVYRIQIGAFQNPKEEVFEYIKTIQNTFSNFKITYNKSKEDGFIKFTIGNFRNFQSALELQSQMQAKGFQSFIVGYKNGYRININRAE